MKMKKKIWHGLSVFLCLFILMLPAKASSIPAERQKPLLVDDAGLLTTEESTALLERRSVRDSKMRWRLSPSIPLTARPHRRMRMITMITMGMVTEKTMTVFCS